MSILYTLDLAFLEGLFIKTRVFNIQLVKIIYSKHIDKIIQLTHRQNYILETHRQDYKVNT